MDIDDISIIIFQERHLKLERFIYRMSNYIGINYEVDFQ